MRLKDKQSIKGEAVVFGAESRKKIVIAVVLVSVMALMWVRLLLHKKPESASAATQVVSTKAEPKGSINLKYIQLPHIEGRHDVLSRDLFSGKTWNMGDKNTAKTSGQEGLKEQGDECIEKIRENVKLEAISSGAVPKAFVNGKLVEKAGRLIVKADGGKYELVIVSITENEVVFAWGEKKFMVTMVKAVEETDE